MTLGPLVYYLGWALPNFQAKNQDVVVPLSVHTKCGYAKMTYVVSAYPIRVCRICGSYLNHKPYCEIIRKAFPIVVLSLHQIVQVVYQLH